MCANMSSEIVIIMVHIIEVGGDFAFRDPKNAFKLTTFDQSAHKPFGFRKLH